MKVFIGIGIVVACVFVGYMGGGGHIGVLWQPFEFLIIIGAAIGAFIISNNSHVIHACIDDVKEVTSTTGQGKSEYTALLGTLFLVFKTARSKGMLALEEHIEKPTESAIFQQFPEFIKNEQALTFLCDYLRMFSLGSENPHQMEDLMMAEIDLLQHEQETIASALQNMADAMPALGIVAAVLGVIHTMGSISQPPEILGHLIGSALVGTFAGILFSYGFIAPLAAAVKGMNAEKTQYIICMKTGLIAYLNGFAPLLAIENARKTVEGAVRPSFYELEATIQKIEGE